ncbi:hypothetical protein [Microbacterium dauci]|uniref:Solute-binding protein family 5 domain-containing protein n=1 Tax=Microbacterium dauci TaxID=3048008 RepID=A0ABT6Z9J6_9MICO|nr:hypothetical protein [Microbacterium sp. LX3-4]MDJ1112835.1 hypothetical protein [Microbacterium sp. LX3-4]
MRSLRRGVAVGIVVGALALSACAPALPPTVVPDSGAVVGWSGALTSFNAAANPTAANLDIAAATRGSFGAIVDGDFVADPTFGVVEIVSDDPFTVRYDLAEPSWSDDIPVDAADLALGWAAAAGLLDEEPPEEAASAFEVDEFARAIEVTFPAPTIGWQSEVTAAVPAHVVGGAAFDLDDPMEAKQAVLQALLSGDAAATAELAEAWRTGFAVAEDGAFAADAALSSGPYLVGAVEALEGGQRISLLPNPTYAGAAMPQLAEVSLVPPGDDPVSALDGTLDIATLPASAALREPVQELERRDYVLQSAHDGTMWALVLSPDGVFSNRAARAAFLRTVPADDMVAAGAGPWAESYTKTTSMVSAPGSRAWDIVTEDSGFTEAIGTPADDAAIDRAEAGVADRARVCVLFDSRSSFAKGAFRALRTAAAEGGWSVADCGTDDPRAARSKNGWDAVIERIPVPESPAEIAAQWGTDGASSLTGTGSADRDERIATLERTVDVYEAREVLASIEATIVDAALARPLAMAPRIVLSAPSVTGVALRSGDDAPLLSTITQWTPVG